MVVESDAFASGSSHQWLEPCQMHLASVAAAMGICLGFPATALDLGGGGRCFESASPVARVPAELSERSAM